MMEHMVATILLSCCSQKMTSRAGVVGNELQQLVDRQDSVHSLLMFAICSHKTHSWRQNGHAVLGPVLRLRCQAVEDVSTVTPHLQNLWQAPLTVQSRPSQAGVCIVRRRCRRLAAVQRRIWPQVAPAHHTRSTVGCNCQRDVAHGSPTCCAVCAAAPAKCTAGSTRTIGSKSLTFVHQRPAIAEASSPAAGEQA